MALILIVWIYTFFITLGTGLFGKKVLGIKTNNLLYILLIGLFVEMLFLHFYLHFFPANLSFYLFNSLFSGACLFLYWPHVKSLFKDVISKFNNWKSPVKTYSVLLSVLILAKSSTESFLFDNESYYIQSVKWMNEYGFVKGLANLHIFLGQMSGLHILQSAFNFGFISNSLNVLNGFILLISSWYFVDNLNLYLNEKNLKHLFLALIPCGNLLFFQFVTSPSPDLSVYLISPIIFYLFYYNYRKNKGNYKLLLVLCIFIVFIKITAAPILILPFILWLKEKYNFHQIKFILTLGLISLIAFMLKNYIISGYVLYPTDILGNLFNPDWKLNEASYYFNLKHGIDTIQFNHNWLENLKTKIIHGGKIDFFFYGWLIVLGFIFPFFVRKNQALGWLYVFGIIQILMLTLTSLQYRFFLHLIIGMTAFTIGVLFKNKTHIVRFLIPTIALLPFLTLVMNLDLKFISSSKHMPLEFRSMHPKNIITPAPNSRYAFKFEKIKLGNLEYFSPVDTETLFWLTGDGNLPCTNEKMIEYFRKRLKIIPQLRSDNLKDGFYAKPIELQ